MAKLSHGGSVTADRDPVCLVTSKFRVQPDQRRGGNSAVQCTLVAPQLI
jgi:hypothetical protein